ncbi:MAG: ferritin-like domain-containing protein [Actinomycetes bacterium]
MADLSALQSALAVEHSAVFGYGIVGGRLGPEDPLARRSYDVHRQRRDALAAALVAAQVVPTPAAAAYEPDGPVVTSRQTRALAASIEEHCATAYVALVETGDAQWRRTASAWLRDCAVLRYRWSGEVPALPGLPSA